MAAIDISFHEIFFFPFRETFEIWRFIPLNICDVYSSKLFLNFISTVGGGCNMQLSGLVA